MPTTALVRIVTCILALGVATSLYGQTDSTGLQAPTGVVSGQVVDMVTQQPVAGATVVVVGTKRGAVTKKDGRFVVTKVPAGIYAVKTTLVGFASDLTNDVVVSPGKPATLVIRLSEGTVQLSEAVVVSDAFKRDGTAITSTQLLTGEEVRRAPGVQEDVIRAVALLPGVAVAGGGRNDLAVRG